MAPVRGHCTERSHLNGALEKSGPTYSAAPVLGSIRNTRRANPGMA